MKTTSISRLAASALVLALAPGARAASAQQRVPADPASAAAAAKVVARIPSADSLRALRLPPHPRLFADAARFAEIRAQIRTDPTARALYERVKGKADRYLADPSLPEHVIPDGLRLLATSRRVLDHVSALSLVGAVERDPRYAAGAWRELRAAAAFPDWNPKHFLDVGEMTTAFSIGYDWLYDQWTEEQRETLRKAIVEKGLAAALRAYHGEPGPPGAIHWIDMEHNWNQVTNGGIGIGALAVMDVAPEPAGEALHDGLVRLPLAMRHYGPDGAWFEGPGYWHYATLYNALILSALDTALGTDYGLSEIPGFDLTGGFPAYLTGPFGPPFAFADVDRGVGPTVGAELFWLAHRFHQPAFAAHQLRFGGPGGRDEGRSSAFNVIWYTPDLKGAAAGPAPLDRHFRLAEVVTMRSSWTDPNALYVGFKGGDNKANHTDLDLGTFVLDALGVRWATELGSDDYNMPGYFDTGSRRWTYYRTRAEGQNTLVIEPDSLPDQDPEAESKVVAFGTNRDGGYAVADLSAAYARRAQRVERGVALLAGRSQVLVQDEIRTARPSRVWWFMHTEAAVEVGSDGSTAVLTRDGKRLWAKVLAPAGARFQVMDARPLPTSPNPKEQDANQRIRKLAVRLDGVTGDTRLGVLLVPLKEGASPPRTLPAVRSLSEWEAAREAAETVPLWGRWEAELAADAPADGTATFPVTLTAPDGGERVVDGFWDGGRVWRVRFLPDEEGVWRYRTGAGSGGAGPAGREGSFTVRRTGSPNRFLAHGPVRVSEDGRYLEHADGTPFFWLGDTAWNGGLKSSVADWASYIADRAGKGFSVAQLVTTQWRAAHANAEGEVAYTGYDDIRIHPSFFRRMDARMDALDRAGILAAPVLLWTLGDSLTNPGKLPEAQAIRLARYLVARYQGNHVAWILAGDENYQRNGDRWRRIGRAVFDRPGHAPVTTHPQGMQWAFDAFADEPWLDFLIYQSGHGDDANTVRWLHSGPPSRAWREGKPRPILNAEPPYEDHLAYQSHQPQSAYNVRRAAYWSLLSTPTAGVSYGAHGVWSWETKPGVPLEHPNSGVAKPWSEAIHLPGSTQMEHLAALFTSLEWWRLRPAAGLVAEEPEDPMRFVGAAASEAGDLAVLYLPVGGSVRLTAAVGRSGEWFDPRTGARTPAAPAAPLLYTAPDARDWVLVLGGGAR